MNTEPNKNIQEEEIDYFTFDAFLLAEQLHDIMPSLRAEYSHLVMEAHTNNDMETANFFRKKRSEINKVYESLKINQDKEFVRTELKKYSLELNNLRGFGK